MRSTHAFGRGAFGEEWILIAQHKFSCPQIKRIILLAISYVRKAQQAGHVGIIHKNARAVAVHFVGVDRSMLRMFANAELFNRAVNFICERQCSRGPAQDIF